MTHAAILGILLLEFIFMCKGLGLEIGSASELIEFSNNVNSGSTYSGETVTLAADVDFTGFSQDFSPIGNRRSSTGFSGTFDGQGYVISNLEMSFSLELVGLFGRVSDGTIKNVVLDSSCSVTSSYDHNSYVSGIIGLISSTTQIYIDSVVNMATVSFTGNKNECTFIGGIASYISSNFVAVINCVNYGTLKHTGSSDGIEIGGIVGNFFTSRSDTDFVKNCLNFGSIIQTNTLNYMYIGGIAGCTSCTDLENVVSITSIEAVNLEQNTGVGGIVGNDDSYTVLTHSFWNNHTEELNSCDDKDSSPSSNVFPNSLITGLNLPLINELNAYSEDSEWKLNCEKVMYNCKNSDRKSNGFNVSTQLILVPKGITCNIVGQEQSEQDPADTSDSSSSSFSPVIPLTPPPQDYSSSLSSSLTSSILPSLLSSSSSSFTQQKQEKEDQIESSSSSSYSIKGLSSSFSILFSSISSREGKLVYSSSSLNNLASGESSGRNSNINNDTKKSNNGERNDNSNSTLIIICVVLVVLILAVAVVLVTLFVLFRGNENRNRKREEEDIPLGDINNRRRFLTDVSEDTSNNSININSNANNRISPVVTLCQTEAIYPQGYIRPAMKKALCEAGLTDSQAELVCVSCNAAAERAEKNGKLPMGFTKDDAAAIAMYTYDFGSNYFESNPYRLINKNLSSYNQKNIIKIRGILCLVMAALRKLPRVSGKILYRGLRREVNLDDKHYTEGNTITWGALTSTSPDSKATKAFLARGSATGKATGTLFIIENAWGYDIQPFSLFPDEEEIILEPGNQFLVKSVIDGQCITIITLTMLESQGIQQNAWK